MLKESDDLDILGVAFDSKMTFEKHLRAVSRAVSQRLGILKKSWLVYSMIGRFSWDTFGVFSCQFWSTILQCGDRLPIYSTPQTTGPCCQWRPFPNLGCIRVTLLIVHLWQCCACCIRTRVTRCTNFLVLYLCRMCLCGLHAVLWSHIGILVRILAAKPRSTAWPMFASQCPCIWNDLADTVFDGVGLAGFKIKANAYLLAYAALSNFFL